MTKPLTEDSAIEAIREFFRGKPFIFFGTGMSCALDLSFGMPALKNALIEQMQHQTLDEVQSNEWMGVAGCLQHGEDLENALNSVSNHELLRIVASITGEFVASLDRL